jgi:hypothetical protein
VSVKATPMTIPDRKLPQLNPTSAVERPLLPRRRAPRCDV